MREVCASAEELDADAPADNDAAGRHALSVTYLPECSHRGWSSGVRAGHAGWQNYRGLLVPFSGKTLAGAEASFQALNEALKNRVEAR